MSLQAELHRAHLARRAGWSEKAVANDLKRQKCAKQHDAIDQPPVAIEPEPEADLTPVWPYHIGEPIPDYRLVYGDPSPKIRIADIQRAVCRYYEISKIDLLSSRHTANVVLPRHVAMYLSKTLTLRSSPYIGRKMGGRDHTTVLHAVRKIDALLQHDPKLQADVAHLVSVLTDEGRYSAWPAAEEEAVPAAHVLGDRG